MSTWMLWTLGLSTALGGQFDLLTRERQGVGAAEEEEAEPEAPPEPVDVPVPDGWPALTLRPPPEAERSASGIARLVVEAGPEGPTPAAADSRVTVHYTGWMAADGTRFDSSVERGVPASFRLDQVIPGWTEALQQMRVGDKVRMWIPGGLAYGETETSPGRPHGTLIFDVELLAFEDLQRRPVPDDVAAPPAGAQRSDSGLAWVVLEQGEDGPTPTRSSTVTVHYAGWLTDGTEFDSSWSRGTPATFPLTGVIRGWTEGLQQMHVGDVVRFWIPEALAYRGAPGKPPGMLVFDVELLAVED